MFRTEPFYPFNFAQNNARISGTFGYSLKNNYIENLIDQVYRYNIQYQFKLGDKLSSNFRIALNGNTSKNILGFFNPRDLSKVNVINNAMNQGMASSLYNLDMQTVFGRFIWDTTTALSFKIHYDFNINLPGKIIIPIFKKRVPLTSDIKIDIDGEAAYSFYKAFDTGLQSNGNTQIYSIKSKALIKLLKNITGAINFTIAYNMSGIDYKYAYPPLGIELLEAQNSKAFGINSRDSDKSYIEIEFGFDIRIVF